MIVSSRSEVFECRWRPSRTLLALYIAMQLASLGAIALTDLAIGWQALLVLVCMMHAAWAVPRQILLGSRTAWRGLRHDEAGWSVWSVAHGWQPVQLLRDSVALPLGVVLRFRPDQSRWPASICIPFDGLPPDEHRRLRVRLKFTRRRWAAPE